MAPLRVAVHGRHGVGRRTVATAMSAAGVAVVGSAAHADIEVLVIAEALKPEDDAVLAAACAAARPVLTVLNKADLMGVGGGGPMATASRRAAGYRALTGVPTVPMVGLLTCAALDDQLVGALRKLITAPADLTSTDAFLECDHSLPRDVRARLLETLDRFGIAHAVLALSRGVEPGQLPALLRRLSDIDAVTARIDEVAAPVRYRRVRSAVAELRSLAVQSDDTQLAEFLSGDDAVLAVMSAAVDVVQAAGMTVDRGDDRAAHLRRAVRWRRYSDGPVNALHRSCGTDICRGSLRLLERAP